MFLKLKLKSVKSQFKDMILFNRQNVGSYASNNILAKKEKQGIKHLYYNIYVQCK